MNENPADKVQIDFPIRVFKNSYYSFKPFIMDRANFQFLEIFEVGHGNRFFVSKKRWEFSEKKLKKFGLDHKGISLFWVLAELLCNSAYDVCLGKKYFLPPLTKSIHRLRESLGHLEKLKVDSEEISIRIHDRDKTRGLSRLNMGMADLSRDTIESLHKDAEKKRKELESHLYHDKHSVKKIKKVGHEIRLANVCPLFHILKENLVLRFDSHYKIILGYIFFLNNLYSFKPSKVNPEDHHILYESFFTFDDKIDNQPRYKKLLGLYDYEKRMRDYFDHLLKSSKKYHSST